MNTISRRIVMTLSGIKYLTFNHDYPIADMSGEEVLKEYLYLSSGCADDLAPRKDVKLGLCTKLESRRKALEDHLVAAVDSRHMESHA
jgi:hypothetical protein